MNQAFDWLIPAPSILPQPLPPELEDSLFDAGRRLFNWLATPRPLGLATHPAALRDKLDAGDRAGLAAQLHAWEAERLARLGLQDIWQPSPFPLELEASTQA